MSRQPAPAPEPPISLAEAAHLLAVSTRTLRRMVDRGELRPIRVGTTIALDRKALASSLGLEDLSRPLLTLHEAADRLGCSPNQVRALTEDRRLRSVRIGRSLRWVLDCPGRL